MENIIDGHSYGSTWGITCFYEDVETKFRAVFESGEDFYAAWGAKKEIVYAEVERGKDELWVVVRTSIDELPELVDTAVWRAFGGNDYADSGFDAICKSHDLDPKKDEARALEILEEIQTQLEDVYQETFALSRRLPRTTTFDEMVDDLSELEDAVNKESGACYVAMVEYIEEWWSAIHEQADMDNGKYA
jgi:hypothetical protein